MSVVVIDQKDGGFLTLDITDILAVLGPRALDAVWRMSNVECVGHWQMLCTISRIKANGSQGEGWPSWLRA